MDSVLKMSDSVGTSSIKTLSFALPHATENKEVFAIHEVALSWLHGTQTIYGDYFIAGLYRQINTAWADILAGKYGVIPPIINQHKLTTSGAFAEMSTYIYQPKRPIWVAVSSLNFQIYNGNASTLITFTLQVVGEVVKVRQDDIVALALQG